MISSGLKVKVHYVGTLDDGTVFEDTRKRGKPFEFVLGDRRMLFDFDRAVAGLSEGTSCKIHIPAISAFGEYNDDLIDEIPTSKLAGAKDLPVGKYIMLRGEGGRPVRAKVVSVDDDVVRFDYNHPMAGKNLNFEIELLEVERKSVIEQERGAHGCDCHKVQEGLQLGSPHGLSDHFQGHHHGEHDCDHVHA